MTLRRRISIAAAAAAALAMLVAVFACYMVLSSQLHGQIDNELQDQAHVLSNSNVNFGDQLPALTPARGGAANYAQVVTMGNDPSILGYINGTRQPIGNAVLPGVNQARAVAVGTSGSTWSTDAVDGVHLRIYTFPVRIEIGGQLVPAAIELGRPLTSVDDLLRTMRLILLVLVLVGIVLAGLFGRLAARRVLAPIAELTETAQVIGETDDLSRRIKVTEDDEAGRMAMRFNEMLERLSASRDALDASVKAQRQLVADASHELRTPVTSLRTNIEVLLEDAVLDEEDRRRLLADVVEQSEELTSLVADLIEVARGDLPEDSIEDTRLDLLVEEALQRARRNNPSVEFTAKLQPVAVHGHAERLSRAINNLLDNAAKHNAPGRPVEVTLTASALAVRDHGGGIDPKDLPYVFDRFFRGINSRSRQGSGLGLAIVKQTAEQHGGTAMAANAATGGAIFTLRLPGVLVQRTAEDDELSSSFLDDGAPMQVRSVVTDDAVVPGERKPPPQ